MSRFFDLYEAWLDERQMMHSPELFRHWAMREYCPGVCRGTITPVHGFTESRISARHPHQWTVRAHNTSVQTWRLLPGLWHGVHLRYMILDESGRAILAERAGLFDAEVPAGRSIEITLGVPPLPPGQYRLQIELVDGDRSTFSQFGVEPMVWPFTVEP